MVRIWLVAAFGAIFLYTVTDMGKNRKLGL